MTSTTTELLISIPLTTPQTLSPADKTNPHLIHKTGVFLAKKNSHKADKSEQQIIILYSNNSAKPRVIEFYLNSHAHTAFAHIPVILLFPDSVLANNSTGIICAYSKIICNQLLITGHKLKVAKMPTECLQLCCSSYTINLISERMNCKYRESNLAQSTGQGEQVKSHHSL